MLRVGRLFAFALLASTALLAAGCGSNNKDKILGKWKLVDSPGYHTAEGRAATQMGLYVVVDFMPDGKMSVSVESDMPGTAERLSQAAGIKTRFDARYKLGFGDNIEITDIDKAARTFLKPGRWVVTINGGYMSAQTADGVEKYERISAYVAPSSGAAARP
jgi:hypothetical protein